MALETTTTLEDSTVETLQELIQLNIDSRDGFREAAEDVDRFDLASEFRKFAEERDKQAEELKVYVELNNETPRKEGSYAAALHRTWINVKNSLAGDDVLAILQECERGEDVIKEAYEDALKSTAGSAINDVLSTQMAQVKAVHDHVRDLRDARKAMS